MSGVDNLVLWGRYRYAKQKPRPSDSDRGFAHFDQAATPSVRARSLSERHSLSCQCVFDELARDWRAWVVESDTGGADECAGGRDRMGENHTAEEAEDGDAAGSFLRN